MRRPVPAHAKGLRLTRFALSALYVVIALSSQALARDGGTREPTLLLACTVGGAAQSGFPAFRAALCRRAQARLSEKGWRTIVVQTERKLADLAAKRPGRPWLHLQITLRSAHAVDGLARWGGPAGGGTGPAVQAGIDDAPLNDNLADLLARTLLDGTPFMTQRN